MPASALGANPAANLDQCANDPAPSPSTDGCDTDASQWVNGNLGASKSVYLEGDSIPYRMTFDNLSTSGTHKVTIEWDTTKSSKHAIDYIDNYNQSVLDANPCLGITMVPACINLSPSSTFAIPADPQVIGAGVTPKPGNLTMWGGTITAVSRPTAIGSTTCTNANSSGPYCYSTGTGFSGDKSAAITVEFTATAANPVLAWGGHIASRADWGLTNSAVSIPGSPYHTRLIDLDGAGGNQDRSLSEGAVIFPGFIHVIKNTTGGDATFGYTASPTPLANFNITTSGGTGHQDFDNIIDFKTYTVAENSPPAHWAFDSLNCTVQSPNGGTQTVNGMTATIGLSEGEEVTCTYANHHVVNSPTIATLLSSSSITVGGTIHDSSTISGATADAGGTVKYRWYSTLASCTDAANTFANPGGTSAGDKTVTNGVVPNSDDATFNTAGTFYWRAWYSGDANNAAASSVCTDETLVVGKASPTVTTDAGDDIVLGVNGSDLTDSATLAGGTAGISGTITFHLYRGADCSPANEVTGSPVTKTVSGNGTYVSPAIHITQTGTYRWVANYGGDNNNNATANGCNEANENVIVSPRSPTVATLLSSSAITVGGTVHDSSTLTGGTSDAGGTVKYRYYSSLAACNADTDGSGGTGAGTKTVTNGIVPNSDDATFNVAGTYYWRAFYSGDPNNDASSSDCLDEALVVGTASPTVTTDAGSDVTLGVNGTDLTDTATLSGGTNDISGTIVFKLFSDANCQTQVGSDVTKTVNGNGVYVSPSIHVDKAGTYHWIANYLGDNNNSATANGCNEDNENVVVNPRSPAVSTDAGPAVTLSVNGTDLTDSATLAGGTTDISGKIVFKLFSDANCQTQVGSDVEKTVNGNGTYTSPAIHVDNAGTYHWIANYLGDDNNNATSNGCNEANENVVVNPRDTSLTTDAGGPFRLGEDGAVDLHDTATLSGSVSGAGGTITFTLYGPDPTPNSDSSDDCTEGNVVGKVSNDNVDGDGQYPSPAISVNSPGVYHWVASYSGDDDDNGSDSLCGAEGENPLVIAPHITVVKSPDEQVIRSGDSVSWTIEVINDGSSTLTDVHVTDAQAPGCARTSADIPGLASMPPAPAQGSDITYTCTRDNNTDSFTNVAVATGTPEVGDDVSSEDSAHVTVIHPAITVSKTPHTQTVAFAGTVTFTIGVKNTGDSVLTDVHVTDAQAPGCARTKADIPQLASMAPGDELSYTCTVANVMVNFTNVATAIGTPPVGPDVSSTDSAAVTVGPPPPPVTHPAISILKNPKSQTVTTGGTATFTITVTNTGDVALTSVTVTDALSPNCNRTIGTLNPGQSVSYTCTRPNVQASFNNVAVATGTAGDKTVRAQDTAPVTAKAPFKPKPVPKVVSHKKPKTTG